MGGSNSMGWKAGSQHIWNITAGEQMRLTSTGLGIGTSSPVGKLSIDPGSSSGTQIDGVHLTKQLNNQANFVAWQQGTIGYRVGIPFGDATFPLCFFYGTSTPTASSPGSERARISSDGTFRVAGAGTAGSTDAVQFSGSAAANSLVLNSSGNLGIGTSSPGAALDVIGNIRVSNGSTFYSQGTLYIRSGVGSNLLLGSNDANGYVILNTDANLGLNVSPGAGLANGGGSLTAKGVVTVAGPLQTHQTSMGVLEYNNSKTSIRSYGATAGTGYIAFNVGGGGNSNDFEAARISTDGTFRVKGAGSAGTTDAVQFSGGAPANSLILNSSGNLLMGTTGLPYANGILSVSGHSRFYQSTADSSSAIFVDKSSATNTTSQVFVQFTISNQSIGSGQINANGASQAAFGSFSDARLKQNIVNLTSQLANIMALRPVEFDYIEKEGGGHQIGFIAQEMQEVYPDAVGMRAPDQMLTVTGWSKTEARLVKAIQEQQSIIESLAARIAALEAA
jgi:hypothetical protein